MSLSLRRVFRVALLTALIVVASAPAPQSPAQPGGTLPPVEEWRQRAKPRYPRLSSTLDQLVEAEQQGSLAAASREMAIPLDAGGQVKIMVWTQPGQAASASSAVAALGGQPSGVLRDSVIAHVPVGALPALAQQPSVLRVDLPVRPIPATVSEGST